MTSSHRTLSRMRAVCLVGAVTVFVFLGVPRIRNDADSFVAAFGARLIELMDWLHGKTPDSDGMKRISADQVETLLIESRLALAAIHDYETVIEEMKSCLDAASDGDECALVKEWCTKHDVSDDAARQVIGEFEARLTVKRHRTETVVDALLEARETGVIDLAILQTAEVADSPLK